MAVTRHSTRENQRKRPAPSVQQYQASRPMTMVTRSRGRRDSLGAPSSFGVASIAHYDEQPDLLHMPLTKRTKYTANTSPASSSVVSKRGKRSVIANDAAGDAAPVIGASSSLVSSSTAEKRAITASHPARSLRNTKLSRFTSDSSDVDAVSNSFVNSASCSPALPSSPVSVLSDSDMSAYDTAASPGDKFDLFSSTLSTAPNFATLNDDDSAEDSDLSDEFYDLPDLDQQVLDTPVVSAPIVSVVTAPSQPEDEPQESDMDVFDSVSKSMEYSVSDIPLVTESEALDKPLRFNWIDEQELKNRRQHARWPIEEDQSSSFSILVNKPAPSPRPSAMMLAAHGAAHPFLGLTLTAFSEKFDMSDEPCIEEFFTEAAAASLDETVEDNGNASGSTDAADWIEKYDKIPISGYRLRNVSLQEPSGMPPAPPTATAPIKAYYRQAVLAASGLNRRSLWSGKARQMVGGSLPYGNVYQ